MGLCHVGIIVACGMLVVCCLRILQAILMSVDCVDAIGMVIILGWHFGGTVWDTAVAGMVLRCLVEGGLKGHPQFLSPSSFLRVAEGEYCSMAWNGLENGLCFVCTLRVVVCISV